MIKAKKTVCPLFFEINKKIVDLSEPLIDDEGKEMVELYYKETLDPNGRGHRNLIKMMMEDGFFKFLPKGDDAWVNFLKPFLKLTRKEKYILVDRHLTYLNSLIFMHLQKRSIRKSSKFVWIGIANWPHKFLPLFARSFAAHSKKSITTRIMLRKSSKNVEMRAVG